MSFGFPLISRSVICSVFLFWSGVCSLLGHDLFLRPETYRSNPDTLVNILVFNGSFDESVSTLQPGSVQKTEMRGPLKQEKLDTSSWESVEAGSKLWRASQQTAGLLGGTNLKHTSSFSMTPGDQGSYVIGMTLKAYRIALNQEPFIEYLKTDAYSDIELADYGFDSPSDLVRERYTKLAKTIIQVGDKISDEVTEPLGLLVEIVPMTNPASVHKGEVLQFRLLKGGEPLINQAVVVGRKTGAFADSEESKLIIHSDDKGVLSLPITHRGNWWLKFIHLEAAPEEDTMDFNSLWASLTFEIN
jgi:hypothetical protein